VESPTGTFIVLHTLADSSDLGLLWEQIYPKWDHSLPWTPINRRAKFDAASFIHGGEIRNRTNTQTNKNAQTVNDISTPCLSACVDNNYYTNDVWCPRVSKPMYIAAYTYK